MSDIKLKRIKILHTTVWLFFNVVIFYLFFAVTTNRIDKWVWIGLGLFALEGAVLLLFKNVCPLTIIARRYSHSQKENFDIYLPNWLAKHNKAIYTAFLFIIVVILVYQLTR